MIAKEMAHIEPAEVNENNTQNHNNNQIVIETGGGRNIMLDTKNMYKLVFQNSSMQKEIWCSKDLKSQ